MKNADVSIFLAQKSHKEQFDNLLQPLQQDERKARANCIIMIMIIIHWQSVSAKDSNELPRKY